MIGSPLRSAFINARPRAALVAATSMVLATTAVVATIVLPSTNAFGVSPVCNHHKRQHKAESEQSTTTVLQRNSHPRQRLSQQQQQHQQRQQRNADWALWFSRSLWHKPWTFRLPTAACQANEASSPLSSVAPPTRPQPWPLQTDDSYHYELMTSPGERASFPDHAIYGVLMQTEAALERYNVYTRVNYNGDDDDNDDDDYDTDTKEPTNEQNVSGTTTDQPEPRELVVADIRIGSKLNGHDGIVHGGILALLIDDAMGYAFYSMGIDFAVTANLTVDYRAPVYQNKDVVLTVKLLKREGRKLYFQSQIKTRKEIDIENDTDGGGNNHNDDDDDSILCVEATSLYIIPRQYYKEAT